MQKLPEVEAAKALMNEAMAWSVMKWLREKKTVRHTADRANEVLDQMSASVRGSWPADLRAAYDALVPRGDERSGAGNQRKQPASAIDSNTALTAKKMKDADDEVYRCRMDAEKDLRRCRTTLEHKHGAGGMPQGNPRLGTARKSNSQSRGADSADLTIRTRRIRFRELVSTPQSAHCNHQSGRSR